MAKDIKKRRADEGWNCKFVESVVVELLANAGECKNECNNNNKKKEEEKEECWNIRPFPCVLTTRQLTEQVASKQ